MMSGRDRISQLPIEILDNILGFLPIVEAARTTVLSTIWRGCWSNLTQLNFDDQFFACVGKKYSGSYNSTTTCMYVINKVLMRHHGPIRKFVLDFKGDVSIIDDGPNSRKFDFDQWFLFITQKGVEEMSIAFLATYEIDGINKYFMLPNCIFSCLTLKRLDLSGVLIAPTINAPCIFPNVTSLSFTGVVFGPITLDCVIDVPMLDTLSFNQCEDVSYFNIKAPRLGSLTLYNYEIDDDIKVYRRITPVNMDLSFIHTFCLDFNFKFFVSELTRWGPELNVECIELAYVEFHGDDDFSSFIHSLRICPKLRKLDIMTVLIDAVISKYTLFEGFKSAAKMLKMLHTLKLRSFNWSMSELRFIMMILACFPALEKVVIIRSVKFDSNNEFKIMQKLLNFPRASRKAKIIYI
ncbi:PREDICTED: F-box/FBD/LRR-repeat protein At1g13570-like isoform X1 [Ipomoea nil]|uniref:F-box/FBD/LRR-repeat protein At1g13570-like isoform X1 n=1 Tax=Ipomoea nil TaxID=35883 RepID=UPI0009013945|nr:PREDICTED: F-box/FBD/LRR-repeat protein At1g13570-like isoform X1 [Ipomoea nil]